MDLELTEEQNILKASAHNFLKKECPPSLLKEMEEDEKGYPQELWDKMVDLGWLGVMIPEEYGGIGGDFMDLSILLEAMGEVCCPAPFFPTVVLGGLGILSAGSEEQKQMLLPKLVGGDLALALAVTEPGAWYETSGMRARATLDGDDYVIDGAKLFVENAHRADYILCAARTEEGKDPDQSISLFLVDGMSPGVECTLLKTLAYDKQCEVVFHKVRVPGQNMLDQKGQALSLLKGLQEKAAVAKCAEMVGVLQAVFDMTIAYAKEREQFGRPIGSFQAVQHHCANMVVDMEGARFLTFQAAWRIAQGLPSGMEASMAKAWTNEASRRVTFLGHQIHGAVSFCEEHDMHLYYRKAKAGEVAFGDGAFHLERVARHLGL
jgi:alkylation response protein AidB-like acyl-CoA dehydrogenase